MSNTSLPFKDVDFNEFPVIKWLDENFFPFYVHNDTSFQIGTILHTLDGRQRTNATIIGRKGDRFIILTDIGNVVKSTEIEILEYYHPPSKRRVSELEFLKIQGTWGS